MDDRYQYQSWAVRAYRWLRFVPYYTLRGLVCVAGWWLFDRNIPMLQTESRQFPMYKSRWDATKSIMRINRSMASGKMKHYWSLKEVMDGVRRNNGL
jgi:hypothetical protein